MTTAVALSVAALTVGVAGTARAELYGIDDPQDTFHGSDILGLSIRNGTENLRVVSYHQNLRRDPATGSRGAVFIDTDRSDRGPEYVFVSPYWSGADYVLLTTESFSRRTWGDRVEQGDYTMRIRYDEDRVKLTMSRKAIGKPGAVRVAMRAWGTRTDGTHHGLVDWVSQRRAFTPWVDRG